MAKGPKVTISILKQIENLIDLAIDQMSEDQTSLTVSLPKFAGLVNIDEADALEQKYRKAGWKTVRIDRYDDVRPRGKDIFVVNLSNF